MWNFLNVTLLTRSVSRWLIDFWKIFFTPVLKVQFMMNWKAFGRTRPWLDRGSDPVFT